MQCCTSVLGLTGAIPILLGDNIGTTITALLASVGQSKNAKRTAVAHSIFNITGSFLFIWIVPWFAKFVQWISPKGPEIEVISRQIANAHTTFNIVCTLCWLPFIWLLVKIVCFIVRGEDEVKGTATSKYLDYNVLAQPSAAIKLVTNEVEDVAKKVELILTNIQKTMHKNDVKILEDITKSTQEISTRIDDTMKYMSSLFAAGSLTEAQAAYTSDLILVLENMDHINIRCEELCGFGYEIIKKKCEFSKEAENEMKKNIGSVLDIYDKVLKYLNGEIENPIREFNENKDTILKQRNKARKNNAKRMEQKECKKASGELFNNTLFSLERITHNCFNMLENGICPFGQEMKEETAE